MTGSAQTRVKIHPGFVRLTHWLNAAAIIVMIGSGWHIYNNHPIFEWLTFPRWATLGGDPEITYAMWVFFLNGLAAILYGFATGRLKRMWFPITWTGFWHDFRDALRLRLTHEDPTMYNIVQRVSYVGVLLAALLVFVSGLAIWKPVQFQTLTWMFYDFQGARLAHFIGMAGIVAFLAVHVALALLEPATLKAMITGSINVKKSAAAMPAAGE